MPVGDLTHTDRFINTVLLVLMVILAMSGIVMLYGTWGPWVFDLHRMSGFALIFILPWKGITIYRSLLRGMQANFNRGAVVLISMVMAHLILLVIALGVMWMLRWGPYQSLFFQTLVAWHWILGLLLTPFLVIHVGWRWPGPKKEDFVSRRDVLKLMGIAAAGVVGGGLTTMIARAQATEERPRRFTGSRGFGFFAGNDFPITGEATVTLDPEQWRLAVTGAVTNPLNLTYREVSARIPELMTEVIDCTSGWYSVQDWQGVLLIDLLEEAQMSSTTAGVRLTSITGYNHTYPLAEARKILLATHTSGEILAPRHGFPLRAVVPDRRGWFWVKWLTQIEVLDSYWEVVGGILWSPRQVLRQF
ncbi:MAG TPA: molybdopterin-dependent oxidoreductase [Anaerolineales bacterium]